MRSCWYFETKQGRDEFRDVALRSREYRSAEMIDIGHQKKRNVSDSKSSYTHAE